MHRTTVMLPLDVKTRALRQARKLGISLGEFLRQSLAAALDRPAETKEDCLLHDEAVFRGQAPRDLSAGHDQYLYGGGA